tara:strand:- start:295 stop:456 length:162 start_codon:yes stop_codon:yes gene_type:complete
MIDVLKTNKKVKGCIFLMIIFLERDILFLVLMNSSILAYFYYLQNVGYLADSN